MFKFNNIFIFLLLCNFMKKKIMWIIIIVIIIVLGLVIFVLRGFTGEDTWIKDSKGVWIKHGVPANTPEKVKLQQDAITCGKELYNKEKGSGKELNSQCLGKCSDYSIDIVHFPRSPEDDLALNQCSDYRKGVTHNFIEIDENGNIVRIVD